jgi:hypothetical protein
MKSKTSPRTDSPGIETRSIKVIKLKSRDRTTLKAMAATYGVADPIDFCHGIIMAADQEDPNPVLFRTYE